MKKITLLLLLSFILTISAVSANTTVGVISSNYDNANLTFSLEQIEFELDINALLNSNLYISADYNLIWKNFSLGAANNFFWNVALGASISYYSELGLAAIAPVELGYRFPIVASGLDVYFQVKPILSLLPTFVDFDFDSGLGVRVAF
ncbi:MAG: hypothetical protein OCD02_22415 [Spirochaetaceae bacterium]